MKFKIFLPSSLLMVTTSCGALNPQTDYGLQDAGASISLTPMKGRNNQDQINRALENGGIVTLKTGVYAISKTIHLTSGSTLLGEPGAVIKLADNVKWPKHIPMILGENVKNVRITGFEIDGNRDRNASGVKCGQYYYDMLQFNGGTYIEVDHMYLHHNWNDIFKITRTENYKFHDNRVDQPGHDVVYATYAKNGWIFNNDIKYACNSGVRSYGSKNMNVYDNDISRAAGAGGNAGIEVQVASNVYLCNNSIHNVAPGKKAIDDLSDGKAQIHMEGCMKPNF